MNFNSFTTSWPDLNHEANGEFQIRTKALNATLSGKLEAEWQKVHLSFGPRFSAEHSQVLNASDLYAIAVALVMIAEDLEEMRRHNGAEEVGEDIIDDVVDFGRDER
jgi:hypothetical protein